MKRRIPYIAHNVNIDYVELAIAALKTQDESVFFDALSMMPRDVRNYNVLAVYASRYGECRALRELLLLLGASNYREMLENATNDCIIELIYELRS